MIKHSMKLKLNEEDEIMNIKDIDKKVVDFIVKKHADGVTSAKIIAYLQIEHDMSGNQARKIWNCVRDAKDLATKGSQGDMVALVKTLRDNHDKVDRKELVTMMSEASGYTESTANHMLSQLNFAKEWTKQEMESK